MTAKTRTTALKGWLVKPEMFKRLPKEMFDIAASPNHAARDRIAAAKMLLMMVQQEMARRKAEPAAARPVVRVQLPENGRAAPRTGR